MKCPFCGSERIEQGIAWGKTAETGNIGLEYTKGKQKEKAFYRLLLWQRYIRISVWTVKQ